MGGNRDINLIDDVMPSEVSMLGGARKRNSMNINQQIDEVFGEKLTHTHTHWGSTWTQF